jgi:histidine triad (HIT) family protein
MLNTLENLVKLARERKNNPLEGSYTNMLLTDKSLSKAKVLEEVDELIQAVEENSNKIHEAADVFYHLLMYLEANDIKIEEVMSELEKRKKMSYDDNNIFAKILRGEIPCDKIYEDDFVLSFHDINPQKKIHALVIPKGKYIDLDDFSLNASPEDMVGLLKGINIVAKKLGISTEVGKGYRALANVSDDGGQEVPHLHFHLFGGEKIGKMVE